GARNSTSLRARRRPRLRPTSPPPPTPAATAEARLARRQGGVSAAPRHLASAPPAPQRRCATRRPPRPDGPCAPRLRASTHPEPPVPPPGPDGAGYSPG